MRGKVNEIENICKIEKNQQSSRQFFERVIKGINLCKMYQEKVSSHKYQYQKLKLKIIKECQKQLYAIELGEKDSMKNQTY